MSVKPVRYIYKRGLYNNYTKDINPRDSPIESLSFIVMWLFGTNRYDVIINTKEEEPYINVKKEDKEIKIASFQTHEGDIIMNIFPKENKEVSDSQDILIDEKDREYFISTFWNTVDDYTFDMAAYLNAPYLGRSMLEEELYQQEQEMDRIYEEYEEYEYKRKVSK